MSVLQRARDSGKCAPSLLLSHPQQTDVDEFDEGLLRAIDSNGFQLRPDAQAADDIIPLLQKSQRVGSSETMNEEATKAILVHRRCIILAVVGGCDPSSPSISRLLDLGYLPVVKQWLEEILNGDVGGVDLLLHLLKHIAHLPVNKAVVKSSGMGKLIGSLDKHNLCTSSPNTSVIKEQVQLVKECWNSSVKARKSQAQPSQMPVDGAGAEEKQAEMQPSSKRLSESGHQNETQPKRVKLTEEPKKASSSFSTLLQKVSGSTTMAAKGSPRPGDQQNNENKTSTSVSQPKKVSKRVKWADHFGGNLSVAQTLESDDAADGAPAASTLESNSSWSDRKKRDRLREKELLASAKKAKIMDDDADDAGIVDSNCQIRVAIAWHVPVRLPELPNVTKPELLSNEKSLQESRKDSVPAAVYTNESNVPSSPHPLTDVEQALDMTSQSSAVLESIPFFVPQDNEALSLPGSAPPSLYPDVTSTLQGIAPTQPASFSNIPTFVGATPEFLQSLGLPLYLVGQDAQAIQTIANSPGLLGTLVDATGQYDQQRLLSLVQTLSSSSGVPSQGQSAQVLPYGQTAGGGIYGQQSVPTQAYGVQTPYTAPASGGFRAKSDAGNLHVSGFGPSTTQNDIIQLFSPYVRVDEVFMKGTFCFVNTSDPVNAQIAREALSGTLLGGMPIRINPAQRKAPRENSTFVAQAAATTSTPVPSSLNFSQQTGRLPPPPPPSTSYPAVANVTGIPNVDDVRDDRGNPATKNLFVAGYGPGTTEQHLRELFSQHAEVIGVVSKGAFSFVNTAAREQAVACRQAFIGTLLNGGALRINFAKESGRLGTSFDLTYGKETGPNARRSTAIGPVPPSMTYGAPPPAFGAQSAYAGGQNYYGP